MVLLDEGEELLAGSPTQVVWGSAGLDGDVAISWSCDDGASWVALGTADVTAGAYDWTPPAIDTQDARVRLSAGAVSDQSDGRFTIIGDGLAPCPVPPPPPEDEQPGCACDAPGATALLPLPMVASLRRRRP